MATVIVSAAVIWDGGEVLLTRRRRGAHLEGYWEFPGGKVEPGEDPEDAPVRECLEECAIDVEVIDILDVTFHRYEDKDVLLLFYECRLGERRQVRDLGVDGHRWCAPSEIASFPLPPPDDGVVRKIRARG